MGEMADRLADRLVLTSDGDNRFVGYAPGAPVRMYGGELAAQALAAANATVGEDRRPHTLQCVYVSGGDPDHPLEHEVERVRDGRSFSTRRVQVHNNDRLALTATVGYHVPEESFSHQRGMPEVPPPQDLPTIAEADGTAWIPWATRNPELDMRVVAPDVTNTLGRRRFWWKVRCDESADPLLHTALAAYASDFTMIASIRLPHESPDVKTHLLTTLTHNVYFHRAFSVSDWNLIDHWSPVASGGRGLTMAHVYSADGDLVMTAVQEALIRPLPPDYTT
jgi:acyl-CoA thioesterase II